jgi:hypothetical protein
MTSNPAWDECLRIMMADSNPLLVRQLMTNRSEVNDLDGTEDSDKTAHETVLTHVNNQLLDRVEYEIMAK